MQPVHCDVAIIGGGPAGSTLASYLKLHRPSLKVCIFERESFPREHVGESQLPTTSFYLNELGVWPEIEAAGFPIKIGATYKWGKSPELWDFDFIADGKFEATARPAKYEGPRRQTAFQVDRAIYDRILLEHARKLGCHVEEHCRVTRVLRDGESVTALELFDGRFIAAETFVDASGNAGILRRALDIECEYPSSLKNIAFWDYWSDSGWANKFETEGTRVQVISIGFGWIWFVPVGRGRVSVGLVVPMEYYKTSRLRPEKLYKLALDSDSTIKALIESACPEGTLRSAKDWSFVAKRLVGQNWFLVGESGGFADPILAAGLTITHAAAREAAFTILELPKGIHDPLWLKSEYEKLQLSRFRNHIRFADYWYSANEQFNDLKAYTRRIALENDLDLSPEAAWRWLGQGGFIDDDLLTGFATLSLSALKGLGTHMQHLEFPNALAEANVFHLNLEGAKLVERSRYENGGVSKYSTLVRAGKHWPQVGVYQYLFDALQRHSSLSALECEFSHLAKARRGDVSFRTWVLDRWKVALEALVEDGWVTTAHDPRFKSPPIINKTKMMRSRTPASSTVVTS